MAEPSLAYFVMFALVGGPMSCAAAIFALDIYKRNFK